VISLFKIFIYTIDKSLYLEVSSGISK